ncbi:MAG: 1-acyl-sn-glycerol-3-phosphate acyltransferase [Pseudomonadota bacterium]
MSTTWSYTRSITFILQMYLMMAIMALLFLIPAIASPEGARLACRTYARYVRWTASWWVGIRSEIRGQVPQGEVIIAAKHQSFLDIILIFGALPRPKFIMKRILLWSPILGQYAYRLGCVPVNRGGRAKAVAKMVADVEAGRADPGQLCIYPQGTRVAPGAHAPYKVGTAILYEQLGQPCVPVATNVGLFWPKRGLRRTPGLAVVKFLPTIPPGLEKEAFMARLESDVESHSNELMAEGGLHLDAE